MPGTLMSTREVAQYLGVHEKQVYVLVKAGRIPATRVTGKWVFLKSLIDECLETDARSGLNRGKPAASRPETVLLAAGSNDPLLDLLQSIFQQDHPAYRLFLTPTGSAEGLRALNLGHADIAWSHLLHPATGEYNLPYFPEYLPRIKPVAVNLFQRDLGLVTPAGNPRGIRGCEDLVRPGIRFINRQEGSGTRLLLDDRLGRIGITPARIAGYGREVLTHHEVGFAVLAGDADVGLATRATANILGLHFLLVTSERFDMVLDQGTFFRPALQALLETIRAERFRAGVTALGNYDLSRSGKIVAATAPPQGAA